MINNVPVPQICHTVPANIVLLAICLGIGTPTVESARAVNKMPTLIQIKNHVSTVLSIALYGTETSVFHAQ